MFSFDIIAGIQKLPAISIRGMETITPDAMVHSDVWDFDDPMIGIEYQAIIEAGRHPHPFLHLVIMHAPGSITIGNGMASLSLSLAIEQAAPIEVRPVPEIEPDILAQEKDQLMHICNMGMASKHNASMLREPSKFLRLRPSGKKRKPSSTVQKNGSVYNKTWEFMAIRWNGKEFIGPKMASQMDCHGRIVSELLTIDERYILGTEEDGCLGKGHHDRAVRCDHCDKVHYIRETIELNHKTMGLFPELQIACDILGI